MKNGNDNNSIDLVNVSKIYRMGKVNVHALRSVDIHIPAGQFAVILGPSGSGKTTLLNMVGGIDTPTEGSISIGKENIHNYDKRQLTDFRRRHIGFIFQSFNLFPTLTALENVEFAADLIAVNGHPYQNPTTHLEAVGLKERLHHFPAELSGGEQQRVAIARALAKNPPILLADEPTGELDVDIGVNILSLLRQVNRETGQTVVLVTHNTIIAQMADRVIRLRSGQVVEDNLVENPVQPTDLNW